MRDFFGRFTKLCQLEADKQVMMGNRGSWVNEVWEWKWGWVRDPRDKALGDLAESESLFSNVLLSQNYSDGCTQFIDTKGGFSIKLLTKRVADLRSNGAMITDQALWNSLIPRIYKKKSNLDRLCGVAEDQKKYTLQYEKAYMVSKDDFIVSK